MSDLSGPKRYQWVYIVAAILVVAGVFVRLWPVLIDRPLWLDEVHTWQTAYNPKFFKLLASAAHKEHPPLSSLFVRPLMKVFGADNFMVMRLPSLVFGVLCIPAAFVLGKRLISTGAGVLFALLVALDQLMIEQSQQARMYTLFMLLLLLALLQLTIATEESRVSNKRWVLLGLLLGALGWTHQLAMVVWPCFAAGVGFFLFRKQKEPLLAGKSGALKTAALVFGTALLIDLPPLLQLLRRLKKHGSTGVSGGGVSLEVLHILTELLGSPPVFIPVLLVCAFGLFLLYRYANRSVAVTVAALGVLTLVAQYPLSQAHHQFSVRYLVPFLAFVWTGLVAAIVYSKGFAKNLTVLIVLVYVAGSFLRSVDFTFVRPSDRYLYGYAADFIMHHIYEGEYVLYYPVYFSIFAEPYAYRYDREHVFWGDRQVQDFQKINTALSDERGVWVACLPKRIQRDINSSNKQLARFDETVTDLGLSLRRERLAAFKGENVVLLYFSGETVCAWEVRAISANKAGVFPIPADGFLE